MVGGGARCDLAIPNEPIHSSWNSPVGCGSASASLRLPPQCPHSVRETSRSNTFPALSASQRRSSCSAVMTQKAYSPERPACGSAATRATSLLEASTAPCLHNSRAQPSSNRPGGCLPLLNGVDQADDIPMAQMLRTEGRGSQGRTLRRRRLSEGSAPALPSPRRHATAASAPPPGPPPTPAAQCPRPARHRDPQACPQR